jgi:SulP family sulfate permease
MKSKIIDFSNLKGDFIGGLVAGGRTPLHLVCNQEWGDSWSIWSNHGRDICSNIGGTPTQASGPTGPMTVVSAALVAASIQLTGSLETALGIILLTFLLGGLLQIFFGLINIGICKIFPP